MFGPYEYCVEVKLPGEHEYVHVEADTPKDAARKALNRLDWNGEGAPFLRVFRANGEFEMQTVPSKRQMVRIK